MPCGSLIGAPALPASSPRQSAAAYFAVWMVLGVAMAASLYDPAFATLGRIFGAGARAPITTLTLAGGFASTVSWPATQFLIDRSAGAAPIWSMPRCSRSSPRRCTPSRCRASAPRRDAAGADARAGAESPRRSCRRTGSPSCWSRRLLPSYAFVPSALSAQLLAIFERFGLSPDDRGRDRHAVRAGAGSGAHLRTRLCAQLHPLWIARFSVGLLVAAFALLALLPFSAAVAAAFAVMYGMANGLMTIARGTVPLALFGAAGYGRLVGRIGGPFLVVQALAPVVLTYVAERASDARGIGAGARPLPLAASDCALRPDPIEPAVSAGIKFDSSALAVEHGVDVALRDVAAVAVEPRAVQVLRAVAPSARRRVLDLVEHARDVILDRVERRHHLGDALAGEVLEIARFENPDDEIGNVLRQPCSILPLSAADRLSAS